MIDLRRYVAAGDGVWWGQASAEPTPLVHALLDAADAIGGVRAFCGLSWDERLTTELPESVTLLSYGSLGRLRALSAAGRLTVVPCNYSALPGLFADGALPGDVGLVQVSPPGADGRCSLGVGVDYVADAAAVTPVLIAEINQRMPNLPGAPSLPLDRFAAVLETDRPLPQAPVRAARPAELAIARHVAGLIEDGDTLQIGVGALPEAVLERLSGHADLGIHSGLVCDGIASLVDKGVITGARKQIDPGRIVTGAALGSGELYERLPELPVDFRAASYTHAPAVLGALRQFVAINGAVEVDLSGQAGSEMRRGVHVGAIGGQADFSHAAAVSGARSIIALRSTSAGESTINPALRWGPVSTARADIDVVVTEHGVAHLRGATSEQRAQRLISIAAPEFRDSLAREQRATHKDRSEA